MLSLFVRVIMRWSIKSKYRRQLHDHKCATTCISVLSVWVDLLRLYQIVDHNDNFSISILVGQARECKHTGCTFSFGLWIYLTWHCKVACHVTVYIAPAHSGSTNYILSTNSLYTCTQCMAWVYYILLVTTHTEHTEVAWITNINWTLCMVLHVSVFW